MKVSLCSLVVAALALHGCSSPCFDAEPAGVSMRFADPSDPTKPLPDFLAHPWPSDARKKAGGWIDLDAFPNPTDSSTLRDYVRVIAQSTKAYGTSSALYVSFTGALDPASIPTDPMAATSRGAPVQLVDIDARSPERGRRYPLTLRYSDRATLYLPANHLIAIPPFGVPLRGDTTYALITTKALRAAGGEATAQNVATNHALYAECAEDSPGALATLFAPLRAFLEKTEDEELEDASEPANNITGATVFTTQGAVREMRELAAVARAQPAPAVENLERVGARDDVIYLRGTVELPGFQHGERPYASLGDGGELARDANGAPMVDHYEHTRVAFTVPRTRDGRVMPENGWPVVLYSHGTGGSYNDAYDEKVADVLARQGIAVVGYDQTLHGPRDPTGSDPDVTFFNLFNPIGARDNVRQGSADLVAMMNVIQNAPVLSAELTQEREARYDPNRIAFLGHSQGSLVAAPFISADDRPKAITFSGLGAILTITLLERKDIVDFKGLLESLLFLPAEEPLEDLHPVLNLIQTFIEPADPISYARSYAEDPPGTAAYDILQVEGFKDFASPARGQEAFASAAHIPLVSPAHRVPLAAQLMGPSPEDAPASANVTTRNGKVTFGLIQYPEETHYPIFENDDANARYVEFLRSALFDGRARIIPEM